MGEERDVWWRASTVTRHHIGM
ncbi:uncharacterized protein G2W53_023817 [Senna tora]|uniref:Uncharacterized protein n=1 Tax=Senna tora TaxID=362788 RepID=A0A834WDA5_9FABA|nr:uncharacterized protein G2W53_023817 [Senna tora]